jgi:hypothetical protein
MTTREEFSDLCIKLQTASVQILKLESSPPTRVFGGVLNSLARQIAVAANCQNLPVEVAACTCRIVMEWKVRTLDLIANHEAILKFETERWFREIEILKSVKLKLPIEWRRALGTDPDPAWLKSRQLNSPEESLRTSETDYDATELSWDFISEFGVERGKPEDLKYRVREHLRGTGIDRAEFDALYDLCSLHMHATAWSAAQEEYGEEPDPLRDAFIEKVFATANEILQLIKQYRTEHLPPSRPNEDVPVDREKVVPEHGVHKR